METSDILRLKMIQSPPLQNACVYVWWSSSWSVSADLQTQTSWSSSAVHGFYVGCYCAYIECVFLVYIIHSQQFICKHNTFYALMQLRLYIHEEYDGI